ncbi:HepT-like ribonuclease domain-containing protein [Algoriphagus mannitolivorans]|uniref:HepT-like ribonuclease domain-containing protein n=1 Tax=Algoriphagus mannitolivorans TaxID=226504 RepID=UPI000424D45C|nr:DUF86 domain-containing protein [Algoriphagus mannitolivorans]
MRSRIGDIVRLKHILEAIEEVESYVLGIGKEEFINKSMIRFACVKQLEIVGEACNHLSEETKQQKPEVPWTEIIGMRHVFVHEYFGIDNHLLWEIINRDLKEFKSAVIDLIATH